MGLKGVILCHSFMSHNCVMRISNGTVYRSGVSLVTPINNDAAWRTNYVSARPTHIRFENNSTTIFIAGEIGIQKKCIL